MKKPFYLLLLLAIIYATGCNNKKKPATETKDASFGFAVTPVTSGFQKLPALQSFAFATANNGAQWLMVGGRTNGFHGFDTSKGGTANFPFKMANKYIYAYDVAKDSLASLPVDSLLSAPLIQQFFSTNIAARQVNNYLYLCGGYGQKVVPLYTPGKIYNIVEGIWETQPRITRIDVPAMVAAIQSGSGAALRSAIVSDTSSFVAITGGELYKMPDGNFYLAFGHNFTGAYSSPNAQQVYLDGVNVFSLTESTTALKVNPITKITDGLPDSTTQFRRRDLNVVPAVLANGSYGLTAYAGVFTWQSGTPFNSGGNPFPNPIYLTTGENPGYTIDTGFTQISNVYSAASLHLYDSDGSRMLTAIFGGIGDTLQYQGDNAAFTQFIQTISRNYKTGITTPIYNSTQMPAYAGAESVFVPAAGLPLYQNNTLGIIDFKALPSGKTLVGYIYGGILSNGPESDPQKNPTQASSAVYQVYITK